MLVEKELKSKISEEISNIYKKQADQMEQQILALRKQLKVYETENSEFVSSEIEKERAKNRIIIEEKDKQINKIMEIILLYKYIVLIYLILKNLMTNFNIKKYLWVGNRRTPSNTTKER